MNTSLTGVDRPRTLHYLQHGRRHSLAVTGYQLTHGGVLIVVQVDQSAPIYLYGVTAAWTGP